MIEDVHCHALRFGGHRYASITKGTSRIAACRELLHAANCCMPRIATATASVVVFPHAVEAHTLFSTSVCGRRAVDVVVEKHPNLTESAIANQMTMR
jgi:hypothetical protein